jgi:hypothetical protein
VGKALIKSALIGFAFERYVFLLIFEGQILRGNPKHRALSEDKPNLQGKRGKKESYCGTLI